MYDTNKRNVKEKKEKQKSRNFCVWLNTEHIHIFFVSFHRWIAHLDRSTTFFQSGCQMYAYVCLSEKRMNFCVEKNNVCCCFRRFCATCKQIKTHFFSILHERSIYSEKKYHLFGWLNDSVDMRNWIQCPIIIFVSKISK